MLDFRLSAELCDSLREPDKGVQNRIIYSVCCNSLLILGTCRHTDSDSRRLNGEATVLPIEQHSLTANGNITMKLKKTSPFSLYILLMFWAVLPPRVQCRMGTTCTSLNWSEDACQFAHDVFFHPIVISKFRRCERGFESTILGLRGSSTNHQTSTPLKKYCRVLRDPIINKTTIYIYIQINTCPCVIISI